MIPEVPRLQVDALAEFGIAANTAFANNIKAAFACSIIHRSISLRLVILVSVFQRKQLLPPRPRTAIGDNLGVNTNNTAKVVQRQGGLDVVIIVNGDDSRSGSDLVLVQTLKIKIIKTIIV